MVLDRHLKILLVFFDPTISINIRGSLEPNLSQPFLCRESTWLLLPSGHLQSICRNKKLQQQASRNAMTAIRTAAKCTHRVLLRHMRLEFYFRHMSSEDGMVSAKCVSRTFQVKDFVVTITLVWLWIEGDLHLEAIFSYCLHGWYEPLFLGTWCEVSEIRKSVPTGWMLPTGGFGVWICTPRSLNPTVDHF